MPPVSLYIHIPYCQAKCPYCDFNSYAAQRWPEEEYVTALRAELAHYARQSPWAGRTIGTIFFGGGTPSLFAPHSIGAVLDSVRSLWPVLPEGRTGLEITLEANPGTVSLEKLIGFRTAGVNRMSFGIQSFHPHHLQRLGRIHNVAEAVQAVELARRAGFTNVSIDLIFALPNQTVAEWEHDLQQACGLLPDHISAYNLTYEEGTAFHLRRAQGQLRQLSEEIEVAMFTRTQDILGAAGYQQYEISNYARPGYACRHNLNYWRSGAYIGVGAGAHGYTGTPPAHSREDNAWGVRWSNEKVPHTYIHAVTQAGHAQTATEHLSARQARGEFVFLGLRCLDGFPAATFRDRFGADFSAVFPHAVQLRDTGLLACTDDRWHLTPRGLLLADSVFATFL